MCDNCRPCTTKKYFENPYAVFTLDQGKQQVRRFDTLENAQRFAKSYLAISTFARLRVYKAVALLEKEEPSIKVTMFE